MNYLCLNSDSRFLKFGYTAMNDCFLAGSTVKLLTPHYWRSITKGYIIRWKDLYSFPNFVLGIMVLRKRYSFCLGKSVNSFPVLFAKNNAKPI